MFQVRELRGPAGPGGTEDVRGVDLPDVVPATRLLHRPHRPHHQFQGMRGGRQYANCFLALVLYHNVSGYGSVELPGPSNTDLDPGITIALDTFE